MKVALILIRTAASAFALGLATPTLGKDASVDEVASCMWTKMPSSTLVFLENTDRTKNLELFLAAASRCSSGNSSLYFKKMRGKLLATKPAVIGADTMRADNVFVCTTGGNADQAACHAPGGQ